MIGVWGGPGCRLPEPPRGHTVRTKRSSFWVATSKAEDALGCTARGEYAVVVGILGRPHCEAGAPAGEPPGPDSQELVGALPRSYARWSTGCFARLRGEFAVALWDSSQQFLVCARDRWGVVPIYVATPPGGLVAFSTDLLALVELIGLSLPGDRERMVRFLACLPPPPGRTFYRDVRMLPGGHWLRLSRTGAEQGQYWWPRTRASALPSTEEEWIATYRDTLARAVAERVPPRGDVAVDLSGGIDSSSVAAIAARGAREAGRSRIVALTLTFPGFPELDEAHHATAAANAAGLEHLVMPVEPRGHALAELLADLVEPDGFDWLGIDEATRRVARQRDCMRILTGRLGDLFGGYERGQLLPELVLSAEFAAAWREACSRGAKSSALALGTSLPLVGAWVRRRRGRRTLESQRTRSSLLRDAIAARHGISGLIEHLSEVQATVHQDPFLDVQHRLSPALLDQGSCLHFRRNVASGVLAVHPFLDERIVGLVGAMPWRLRRRNGLSRFILREAMKGLLPETVRLRRDKARFARFYEAGYLHTIRTEVMPVARTWFEPIEDLVDIPRIMAALPTLSPGSFDRSLALWHAVTLAYWVRHAPNLKR